jgi:hypothetical protein
MIYSLNPNVSLEKILPEQPENYTISKETFFAWRVTDFGLKTYNSSILFEVSASYEIYDNIDTKVKNFKSFASTSCKGSHYENIFNNSIYKAEDWNCLDFKQIENLQIFGSWDTIEYSYLLLQMQICDIDYINSKKRNCKDFKKVKDSLSKNNLLMNFLYYEVDFKANNYESPLQKVFKTYFFNINLNLQKMDFLKFQNTKLEQDDSYLFSGQIEKANMYGIYPLEKLNFFRSDEELKLIYDSDEQKTEENFYSLFIMFDMVFNKYSRNYLKIQDVMGNVNGFMEFFILIVSFVSIYSDFRLEYYLFNKLVNVKVKDRKPFLFNNVDVNFDKNKSLNKNICNVSNDKNGNNENIINNQYEAPKKFSEINGSANANKKNDYSYIDKIKPNVILEKNNLSLKFNSHRSFEAELENLNMGILIENKRDPDFSSSEKCNSESNKNEDKNFESVKNKIAKICEKLPSTIECVIKDNIINDLTEVKNLEDAKTACINNENKQFNAININDNNIFLGNLKEIKKDEKKVLSKLNQLIEKKKRYLNPSFCNYFSIILCKLFCFYKNKSRKENNTNYFDFKMLEKFNGKINKKFEIFYYLKWLRNFKNIKEFVLENKTNSQTFDILAKHFYVIKPINACDYSILKKHKINIDTDTLRNNIQGVFESNNLKLKQYLSNKLCDLL